MTEQTPPTTPPGWYPDPKMAGTQRYWDGARWTEHAAPMQVVAARPVGNDSTLETLGWVTAILFPIAGVVIGIILATRNNSKGVPILLVSILVASVAYVVLSNQTTTYY